MCRTVKKINFNSEHLKFLNLEIMNFNRSFFSETYQNILKCTQNTIQNQQRR